MRKQLPSSQRSATRTLAIFLPLLMGLLAVWIAARSCAAPPTRESVASWQPRGLGGHGAMFAPAISPVDPRLMMVNCDMSGAYLSDDDGKNWRLIHHSQLRSCIRCRPAFHPTDATTIYAGCGRSTLKVTRDGGETWRPIGNLPADIDLQGEIAIDPGRPDRMLLGSADGAYLSTDAGSTWKHCPGPAGPAVGFHFDQTSPPQRRICFAATAQGIWRSDDGGLSWTEKSAGLPWRGLRSFAGGSNAANQTVILYCAIPSRDQGGLGGGIFRSMDRGQSWQSAMGEGINLDTRAADQWADGPIAQYHFVLTTNLKPATVYCLNADTGVKPPHHATVYRSDDAGRSWRATFYADPRFKPFNAEMDYLTVNVKQYYQATASGAAIDPADPDHLLQLDDGRCYITTDGGASWFCGHTHPAPHTNPPGAVPAWLCDGLVVTTTWNYYIDPFQPNIHYIAYTDIGLARSLDAGETWCWWATEGRAPWDNTCYELAFDPQVPGKIWGAFSNIHDIPNANIVWGRHNAQGAGGVCVSTDFGASWKPCNNGLPLAPCLSVVVDPASPRDRRTLYASLFGYGVFKSVDGGESWRKASDGLGSEQNMRVCRVQLHADGTLFVLITGLRRNGRFLPEGPGIYRSGDGARTWQWLNAGRAGLLWPKDFTVNPKDSRIIYVGACDANGQQQGGLYRSSDAGVTWMRLARKGPEHFGAYLHPHRPGWIYMTLCEDAPGAGLWLSRDNGASWQAMEGIPFANIQRVAFDPAADSVIYLTTFGASVWRGPAQ